MKNMFKELAEFKNGRKDTCEKIQSHGLPIIIFGAGQVAQELTEDLIEFNVKVDGYAVDDKYYKPNKEYLGCPVYRFSELAKTPEKYVFLLGIEDDLLGGTRAYDFLHDTGITSYALVRTTFVEPIAFSFIEKNHLALEETFNLFGDNLSRETMIAYLKSKLTGSPFWNWEVFRPNEFFNDLTIDSFCTKGKGSFIDCGANIGDTIEEFIKWSGGNYERIFGIEADPINFYTMKNFVEEQNFRDVVPLNCGAWNENSAITFNSLGSGISRVSAAGKVTISTKKLDDIVDSDRINFIKMDIEGSEIPALQGAESVIKKYKPILAISAYHKKDDLITIPQLINNIRNDYRFYLRKHTRIAENELVLYAIP